MSALGGWTPTQVGLNLTPHLVPVLIPPSSFPCLPLFLCCLPAPKCMSPPVGLSHRGKGCWGHGSEVRTVAWGAWLRMLLNGGTDSGVWGIWGGSSVCPNLCLSFPFCNHAVALHNPVLF